jgi:hypothetical protein
VYIAWEGLPGVATMKRSHLKLANRHERWLAERVAQHDQQVTQVAVARPSPRREPGPAFRACMAGRVELPGHNPGASSPHPGVVTGIERWGQLAPRADSQPGSLNDIPGTTTANRSTPYLPA